MTQEDRQFFESIFGDLSQGFGLEYNLFCCEEGILIAQTLETKEKIVEFNKMDWNEQLKLVPGLNNGHSGNTFDMACEFAISYLPQLLMNKRDERIDTIVKSDSKV